MKNSAYWKERFQQMENARHETSNEKIIEIQQQIDKAQHAIEEKINAWYQRFAENNELSLVDAQKLLNSKELKEFKWDVNDYIKYGKENALNQQWMKELENASARVHISRLEQIKLQTQQYAEVAFGSYNDILDNHIRDLYKQDYYHTAYEMQKGIGVGYGFAGLDEDKVSKIISKPWASDGANFSDRIWTSKNKLINQLHTSLTQMCITGEGPDRAIKEIAKAMGSSKYQAGRLVMTESAFFGLAAQKECFNELGVEKYEIVATLDGHTSDICQEMDGKVFKMSEYEEGVTAPPFHVYCRSCTCPYFDDEFARGGRAARGEDGKTYYVPDDMTYKEWKNQNDELTLNDVNDKILKRTIQRKERNTGAFSNLKVPMQKRTVRNIAANYGIDLKGITIKIQRQEKMLALQIMGCADYDNIGRIDLFPNAFIDEEQLIKTLVHEKCHVEQLKKYGKKYVQEHLDEMEKEAYLLENKWYELNKKVKK